METNFSTVVLSDRWKMLKYHFSSTTSSWENVCQIKKDKVFLNEEHY